MVCPYENKEAKAGHHCIYQKIYTRKRKPSKHRRIDEKICVSKSRNLFSDNQAKAGDVNSAIIPRTLLECSEDNLNAKKTYEIEGCHNISCGLSKDVLMTARDKLKIVCKPFTFDKNKPETVNKESHFSTDIRECRMCKHKDEIILKTDYDKNVCEKLEDTRYKQNVDTVCYVKKLLVGDREGIWTSSLMAASRKNLQNKVQTKCDLWFMKSDKSENYKLYPMNNKVIKREIDSDNLSKKTGKKTKYRKQIVLCGNHESQYNCEHKRGLIIGGDIIPENITGFSDRYANKQFVDIANFNVQKQRKAYLFIESAKRRKIQDVHFREILNPNLNWGFHSNTNNNHNSDSETDESDTGSQSIVTDDSKNKTDEDCTRLGSHVDYDQSSRSEGIISCTVTEGCGGSPIDCECISECSENCGSFTSRADICQDTTVSDDLFSDDDFQKADPTFSLYNFDSDFTHEEEIAPAEIMTVNSTQSEIRTVIKAPHRKRTESSVIADIWADTSMLSENQTDSTEAHLTSCSMTESHQTECTVPEPEDNPFHPLVTQTEMLPMSNIEAKPLALKIVSFTTNHYESCKRILDNFKNKLFSTRLGKNHEKYHSRRKRDTAVRKSVSNSEAVNIISERYLPPSSESDSNISIVKETDDDPVSILSNIPEMIASPGKYPAQTDPVKKVRMICVNTSRSRVKKNINNETPSQGLARNLSPRFKLGQKEVDSKHFRFGRQKKNLNPQQEDLVSARKYAANPVMVDKCCGSDESGISSEDEEISTVSLERNIATDVVEEKTKLSLEKPVTSINEEKVCCQQSSALRESLIDDRSEDYLRQTAYQEKHDVSTSEISTIEGDQTSRRSKHVDSTPTESFETTDSQTHTASHYKNILKTRKSKNKKRMKDGKSTSKAKLTEGKRKHVKIPDTIRSKEGIPAEHSKIKESTGPESSKRIEMLSEDFDTKITKRDTNSIIIKIMIDEKRAEESRSKQIIIDGSSKQSEIITPDTIKTSEIITPDTIKTSEIITPDTIKTSEIIIADTVTSSEIITPDAVTSSEFITPDEVKSSEIITPDTVKSNEIITPDTVESSEIITPDKVTSSEIITPDKVKSGEIITPDTVKSSEIMTPDTVKSCEIKTLDTVESSEMLSPIESSSTETESEEITKSDESLQVEMTKINDNLADEGVEQEQTLSPENNKAAETQLESTDNLTTDNKIKENATVKETERQTSETVDIITPAEGSACKDITLNEGDKHNEVIASNYIQYNEILTGEAVRDNEETQHTESKERLTAEKCSNNSDILAAKISELSDSVKDKIKEQVTGSNCATVVPSSNPEPKAEKVCVETELVTHSSNCKQEEESINQQQATMNSVQPQSNAVVPAPTTDSKEGTFPKREPVRAKSGYSPQQGQKTKIYASRRNPAKQTSPTVSREVTKSETKKSVTKPDTRKSKQSNSAKQGKDPENTTPQRSAFRVYSSLGIQRTQKLHKKNSNKNTKLYGKERRDHKKSTGSRAAAHKSAGRAPAKAQAMLKHTSHKSDYDVRTLLKAIDESHSNQKGLALNELTFCQPMKRGDKRYNEIPVPLVDPTSHPSHFTVPNYFSYNSRRSPIPSVSASSVTSPKSSVSGSIYFELSNEKSDIPLPSERLHGGRKLHVTEDLYFEHYKRKPTSLDGLKYLDQFYKGAGMKKPDGARMRRFRESAQCYERNVTPGLGKRPESLGEGKGSFRIMHLGNQGCWLPESSHTEIMKQTEEDETSEIFLCHNKPLQDDENDLDELLISSNKLFENRSPIDNVLVDEEDCGEHNKLIGRKRDDIDHNDDGAGAVKLETETSRQIRDVSRVQDLDIYENIHMVCNNRQCNEHIQRFQNSQQQSLITNKNKNEAPKMVDPPENHGSKAEGDKSDEEGSDLHRLHRCVKEDYRGKGDGDECDPYLKQKVAMLNLHSDGADRIKIASTQEFYRKRHRSSSLVIDLASMIDDLYMQNVDSAKEISHERVSQEQKVSSVGTSIATEPARIKCDVAELEKGIEVETSTHLIRDFHTNLIKEMRKSSGETYESERYGAKNSSDVQIRHLFRNNWQTSLDHCDIESALKVLDHNEFEENRGDCKTRSLSDKNYPLVKTNDEIGKHRNGDKTSELGKHTSIDKTSELGKLTNGDKASELGNHTNVANTSIQRNIDESNKEIVDRRCDGRNKAFAGTKFESEIKNTHLPLYAVEADTDKLLSLIQKERLPAHMTGHGRMPSSDRKRPLQETRIEHDLGYKSSSGFTDIHSDFNQERNRYSVCESPYECSAKDSFSKDDSFRVVRCSFKNSFDDRYTGYEAKRKNLLEQKLGFGYRELEQNPSSTEAPSRAKSEMPHRPVVPQYRFETTNESSRNLECMPAANKETPEQRHHFGRRDSLANNVAKETPDVCLPHQQGRSSVSVLGQSDQARPAALNRSKYQKMTSCCGKSENSKPKKIVTFQEEGDVSRTGRTKSQVQVDGKENRQLQQNDKKVEEEHDKPVPQRRCWDSSTKDSLDKRSVNNVAQEDTSQCVKAENLDRGERYTHSELRSTENSGKKVRRPGMVSYVFKQGLQKPERVTSDKFKSNAGGLPVDTSDWGTETNKHLTTTENTKSSDLLVPKRKDSNLSMKGTNQELRNVKTERTRQEHDALETKDSLNRCHRVSAGCELPEPSQFCAEEYVSNSLARLNSNGRSPQYSSSDASINNRPELSLKSRDSAEYKVVGKTRFVETNTENITTRGDSRTASCSNRGSNISGTASRQNEFTSRFPDSSVSVLPGDTSLANRPSRARGGETPREKPRPDLANRRSTSPFESTSYGNREVNASRSVSCDDVCSHSQTKDANRYSVAKGHEVNRREYHHKYVLTTPPYQYLNNRDDYEGRACHIHAKRVPQLRSSNKHLYTDDRGHNEMHMQKVGDHSSEGYFIPEHSEQSSEDPTTRVKDQPILSRFSPEMRGEGTRTTLEYHEGYQVRNTDSHKSREDTRVKQRNIYYDAARDNVHKKNDEMYTDDMKSETRLTEPNSSRVHRDRCQLFDQHAEDHSIGRYSELKLQDSCRKCYQRQDSGANVYTNDQDMDRVSLIHDRVYNRSNQSEMVNVQSRKPQTSVKVGPEVFYRRAQRSFPAYYKRRAKESPRVNAAGFSRHDFFGVANNNFSVTSNHNLSEMPEDMEGDSCTDDSGNFGILSKFLNKFPCSERIQLVNHEENECRRSGDQKHSFYHIDGSGEGFSPVTDRVQDAGFVHTGTREECYQRKHKSRQTNSPDLSQAGVGNLRSDYKKNVNSNAANDGKKPRGKMSKEHNLFKCVKPTKKLRNKRRAIAVAVTKKKVSKPQLHDNPSDILPMLRMSMRNSTSTDDLGVHTKLQNRPRDIDKHKTHTKLGTPQTYCNNQDKAHHHIIGNSDTDLRTIMLTILLALSLGSNCHSFISQGRFYPLAFADESLFKYIVLLLAIETVSKMFFPASRHWWYCSLKQALNMCNFRLVLITSSVFILIWSLTSLL